MLLHEIALTLIPDVGDVNGKKLVAYCGGVEAIFREKKQNLLKIPGIGEKVVENIINHSVFDRAEKEIEFIEKYQITPLFFLDSAYPQRLKHCVDSPIMLYYKGSASLNAPRILAVVGTRKPTTYGKLQCEKIIKALQPYNPLIVSGLAYGIDGLAHKTSLDCGLETIGVLAHGLDMLYPATNRNLAGKMIHQGGLLTEFMSNTIADPSFFPRRNRIVAGMADAVLVIESKKEGGALITAELANSYNRDVFALPGRVGDEYSEGCNMLIRTNQAALIESAENIAWMLGWTDEKTSVKPQARELFIELSAEEEILYKLLQTHGECGPDFLSLQSKLNLSKTASTLLNLEFKGLVKMMPGKRYRLT